MKLNLSRSFLLFSAAIILFSGCGRRQHDVSVGFVTNNTAIFWNYAKKGAEKAAEEFKVELEFRKPPTGQASQQKEIIDALLDKGIDAIAVSVKDPTNQSAYLKTVADQIPLLTQDNDAPESGRLCYIGTDNYKAGKAVGELVKQAMPEGGTIAIFVGSISELNARQRRLGVLDELAVTKDATGSTYGKYKLFGSGPDRTGAFTDGVDTEKAKERADFVLSKFPNEENLCLIGLWAYNPPAIYAAVKAQNREGKVKIVGFDEDETTLLGIENGHIYGTVAQQPFLFGYESVRIMAAVARGDRSVLPESKILPIDHIVVTQENVADFRKKLKDQLGE